jgi:hypothetical protein
MDGTGNSFSSDEINFLIYRYLLENGKDLDYTKKYSRILLGSFNEFFNGFLVGEQQKSVHTLFCTFKSNQT